MPEKVNYKWKMHPRNGTQKPGEKYRTEKNAVIKFKNQIMTLTADWKNQKKKALVRIGHQKLPRLKYGEKVMKTTEKLIRYMRYYIIV